MWVQILFQDDMGSGDYTRRVNEEALIDYIKSAWQAVGTYQIVITRSSDEKQEKAPKLRRTRPRSVIYRDGSLTSFDETVTSFAESNYDRDIAEFTADDFEDNT